MDIKFTNKRDVVLKSAHLVDGVIVDDCGEEINIIEVIQKVFGEDDFKLTLTKSTNKDVELGDLEDDSVDEE